MTTQPETDVQTYRDRLAELWDGVRADLEDLVRIPSVSAAAFDQVHVAASAERVAGLLRDAGMPEVEVLTAPRPDGTVGAPAVVARRPAPAGAPTVLLYAHHDVQPPGREQDWTTPPFDPVERDGRLYGRGTADDKAGVMTHVAALRALLPTWGPDDGVGVTVFVEGEEEVGSPSFGAFLREHRDRLAADVMVVADSDNWTVDQPSLTTSLRGLVEAVVEVRTLRHAVHSGMYGGAVPDAMTATLRLLDRLWDDDGAVAVPGLLRSEAADLDYAEQTLRADAGVLDGVRLLGRGSLLSRMWTQPSLTVVGIDAPSVAHASNTLQPAVRAKLSLRVAPGQDPAEAYEALRRHLLDSAPFGAQVDVTLKETGSAFAGELDGPVYDTARWALSQAWDGADVVHAGVGGSIPFVADLKEQFPDATVLITGVEDPDTRAHGYDESLHLTVLRRAALAETLLLAALSGR
ncbi:dipeptidase [Quadrisphaera sp. GCM10027208]|uniref:dipeptidase n=1 Tax=Quadrisphaera sp. GCM10027208 TaxID=3273423 RepID=UPI003620AD4C